MKFCSFSFLLFFLIPFYSWAFLNKELNPLGSYLYVDYFEDDKAQPATALLFKELGLKEQDKIELSFYSPLKDVKQVLAVFSNRAGEFIPFKEELISPVSRPTRYSKITTDIPYDFEVLFDKCLSLTIPKNSDRLLFSLNDSFFSNNKNISVNIKARKPLFQIKEKTIYQVVDSPKWNLKNNLNVFDLAKNKTAILHLVYEKLDDNFTPPPQFFKPVIKINGQIHKPKCFIDNKQKDCSFTLKAFDRRGLLEQSLILPMREKEALDRKGSFQIDFGFESQTCKSDFTSYSFNLNIHKTRKLQMGFTLIGGADSNKWDNFIEDSLLDFDLLKRIYPVPDTGPNTPQWIFLNQRLRTQTLAHKSLNSPNSSSIEGSLPNSLNSISSNNMSKGKIIRLREQDFNKSSGLLKDLTALKKMRIKQQLDKLFAVADKDYFKRIHKENTAGFVVFTDSASSTENVGFIRLDQGGTGTILHELGHLLGQLNEFYQKSFQNLSVNDICHFEEKTDYCFKFKNFKGFYGSLTEDYEKWSFITRKDSIMNNSSDLDEQWIDRDTYGKALKTLSDPKLDPEILIFSGLFNKETFIDSELEYIAEGYLTADNPKGNLKIKLLDEKSRELYSLRISTKISIEFIDSSSNKPSITEELTPAPVAVALPYLKEGKRLVVVDEDTGNKIYTQTLNKNTIIRASQKPDLSDRIVFE